MMEKPTKKLIRVSVRQAAEFICRSGNLEGGSFQTPERALEGTRVHQKLQSNRSDTYQKEVPLSFDIQKENFTLRIEGRADGIERVCLEDGSEIWRIEEIKSTYADKENLSFSRNTMHRAQLLMYGYPFFCSQYKEEERESRLEETILQMRLTYYQMEEEQEYSFDENWNMKELRDFFMEIALEYARWVQFRLEHEEKRNLCLEETAFPFDSYRKGQRTMCSVIYSSIRDEKGVFIQAPTGIGKTMSALFPALKGMGKGYVTRLMYLTAKSAAAVVAMEALELLSKKQSSYEKQPQWEVSSVFITARDKICPLPIERCDRTECDMAKGHYDRINGALWAILNEKRTYSREVLLEYADRYQVCPYELSKECAQWSDVIVGDYNYAFDPGVAMRTMLEDPQQPMALLIDEAHNLPSRAQEMFSAALTLSEVQGVQKHLEQKKNKGNRALRKNVSELIQYLQELFPEREENDPEEELPEQKEEPVLTKVYSRPSDSLAMLLDRIRIQTGNYLTKYKENDLILTDFYFQLMFFLKLMEEFDLSSAVFARKDGPEIACHIYCVHPAARLRAVYQSLRSVVFFSATLLPIDFYKELLGGKEPLHLKNDEEKKDSAKVTKAKASIAEEANSEAAGPNASMNETGKNEEKGMDAIYLSSPFNPDHKAVFCLSGIRTDYRGRQNSLNQVISVIYRTYAARPGKYIVFFPSYPYLEMAADEFEISYPDITIWRQKSGMTDAQKREWMACFDDPEQKGIGFAVLGGSFSEGIDLRGEKLIGTMIITVGMPQVCLERDLIRDNMERLGKDGFDYAYLYPGLGRVFQAAGRLIRTESDQGVILLVDQRYLQQRYRKLFPPDWNPRIVRPEELSDGLAEFWSQRT